MFFDEAVLVILLRLIDNLTCLQKISYPLIIHIQKLLKEIFLR